MEIIALTVRIELLSNKQDNNIEPEKLLRLRYEFTNADLMVRTLTSNIGQLDQALIIAKQRLASTNPELRHKIELLNTLKARLDKRRIEIGNNFDDMIAKETNKNDKNHLDSIRAQLKQTIVYETHLKDLLAQEDIETIELGRKQLAIQDMQDQLNLTKEIYETVRRRIQELEMERKRPARVSEAYYAYTAPFQDKRVKFSMTLILGALAAGVSLALIKDKLDLSLHSPDDVTKNVGMRILGTTTCSNDIKKALLPKQIADDYQTICANLGLHNNGDGIPCKLVITSPCPKEGKTTFAINLATSLAKSGKKYPPDRWRPEKT